MPARLPQLLGLADPAPARTGRRVPLLRLSSRAAPGRAPAAGGEYLKLTGHGTERVVEAVEAAFPEARVDAPRPRSRRPTRSSGQAARRLRGGRDRHPGGHPDDRQGARLPASDPGRRDRRRRRAGSARLPLGRADLPAADPGGGAGRPRRARRRGDPAEPPPDHYALGLACAQDYRGLLRAGDRVSHDDGLSAATAPS